MLTKKQIFDALCEKLGMTVEEKAIVAGYLPPGAKEELEKEERDDA